MYKRQPQTNSISSGQVLQEPYDYEKTKLIVREMTDLLVLDLEMCIRDSHKRAGDGDTGLNTGGMGNFSPSPFYTKEVDDFCKSCSIMSGFGGAGAFSDGKYNITNDFGGTLYLSLIHI